MSEPVPKIVNCVSDPPFGSARQLEIQRELEATRADPGIPRSTLQALLWRWTGTFEEIREGAPVSAAVYSRCIADLAAILAAEPKESWLETDRPDVVACMGSVPACAEWGCQARKMLPNPTWQETPRHEWTADEIDPSLARR